MSDKYKNANIYTIRYKNDDSLIYIGSTVQPLFKKFTRVPPWVASLTNRNLNRT